MIGDSVYNEWEREEKEKAEHESRYGDKPEAFTWDEWLGLDEKLKEKISKGQLSVDAVRRRLDRQQQQEENT